MEKVVEKFKKEFEDGIENLPEDLSPQSIRVLADVASILTALSSGWEPPHIAFMSNEDRKSAAWKDDIQEELESAEEKYRQYRKTGEQIMLDMARDELRHAAYYLNHAKMSPDMKLKERLPEYQERYDKLEVMIKAPHGPEKLPEL